jgi:hypothetical protein
VIVCHAGAMNDEQETSQPVDDDFDDVLGDEGDFTQDEYRLSTRRPV